jgi:hypothetical protein
MIVCRQRGSFNSIFTVRACVLGACALIALGCSKPSPALDVSRLPEYGAEDAALLDDGFSGHLFETAFVPGTAGDDPHFDDRVRAARHIWLVKVATLSREGSQGTNRRYEVTLRILEDLSGATSAPPPQVSLTISGKDPSFHWIDRVGGAWVGRELLLLSRDYRVAPRNGSGSAEAGERVLHFHGVPNTAELRARVQRVRADALAAERAARAKKK